MIDVIAVAVSVALLAIAGLHAYWALGGFWPGRDAASLNALVVGQRAGTAMPPRLATAGVSLGLIGIALGAVSARGLIALPAPGLVRALTWVAVALLAIRGLGGWFSQRLWPHIAELPYARWNRRLYSPLCVALAAGLVLALRG